MLLSEYVTSMPTAIILLDFMFVPVTMDSQEMTKLAQVRICSVFLGEKVHVFHRTGNRGYTYVGIIILAETATLIKQKNDCNRQHITPDISPARLAYSILVHFVAVVYEATTSNLFIP